MNISEPGFFPFLLIVLLLFYIGPSSLRLLTLALASYLYVWFFSWHALAYLILVTFFSYGGAFAVARTEESGRYRTPVLGFFIAGILAVLAYTKYLTVVLENLFMAIDGLPAGPEGAWHIVAPLGLSYYSFQAIGYLLDVHWGKVVPERNLLRYALFLAFFPKFLIGPIERADGLLPAIGKLPGHRFQYDQAKQGLLLMAWGLFLKLVMADHIGVLVDEGYGNPETVSAGILPVYSFLFYFQLYYDFSGYTRIARGIALLFGLPLRKNFNHPFLATTMQDFWRRWHLSLSTWINDYLYFPLRMHYRKAGTRGLFVTLVFTFLVLGIWHGPTFPYLLFGLYHGCAMCLSTWSLPRRDRFWMAHGQLKKPWLTYSRRAATFVGVWIGMAIFRCQTAAEVGRLFQGVGHVVAFPGELLGKVSGVEVFLAVLFTLGVESVHWLERRGSIRSLLFSGPAPVRWALYLILSLAILLLGKLQEQPTTLYAHF